MPKTYCLTAPEGSSYESTTPGEHRGNRRGKIYSRLRQNEFEAIRLRGEDSAPICRIEFPQFN
jgi:hypothetical protein